MKKFAWVFLFLLGFLLFSPFNESAYAASGQTRPGKSTFHNYISLNAWSFDSLKLGTDDSAFLVQDSVSSLGYTTASLGRVQYPQSTAYDRMPDSVAFVVLWSGEADAVSMRFLYQVSRFGATGPWIDVGTPDTLTMTGAGRSAAVMSLPISRKFHPNAHHRIQLKGTTATDTSKVYKVEAFPQFR